MWQRHIRNDLTSWQGLLILVEMGNTHKNQLEVFCSILKGENETLEVYRSLALVVPM